MQQALTPSSITKRRNAFLRDLRNIQRQDLKQRARSEFTTYTANQQLSYLIANTGNRISTQQLSRLISYANKRYYKAVAHIGNLVIDGVIQIAQLEKFTLEPDYHEYWLWLIEVLAQKEYCTLGWLQHCLKAIAPHRVQKTVKHALSTFLKIISSSLYSPLMLKDENVLLNIFNAGLRVDSAAIMAMKLINELLYKERDLCQRLNEGILRQRIIGVLKNGLTSHILLMKMLSFKILKSLAQKKVFFDKQLNAIFFKFMRSHDYNLFSQAFLNYLLQFTINASQQDIIKMIDEGLLIELLEWKQKMEQKQDEQAVLIVKISREIKEKTVNLGMISRGIVRELDRLGLLSLKNSYSFS